MTRNERAARDEAWAWVADNVGLAYYLADRLGTAASLPELDDEVSVVLEAMYRARLGWRPDGGATFKNYTCTLAARDLADWRRRRNWHGFTWEGPGSPGRADRPVGGTGDLADRGAGVLDRLVADEERALVAAAVAGLPERHRLAVETRLAGRPAADLAGRLGLREKTARAFYPAAVRRLAATLAGD